MERMLARCLHVSKTRAWRGKLHYSIKGVSVCEIEGIGRGVS